MKSATLLIAALAGVVAAGPAVADIPLNDGEIKCVAQLNKRGANVAKAQGKQNRACVRMAGKGKIAAENACLDGDAKGKIEKARSKTVEDFAKHCGDVPDLGPSDAAAVNDAYEDQARGVARDVFGDLAVAVVLADDDADHAKCQDKLIKDAGKIFDTKTKAFNACKKNSAAAGIAAAADLEGCVTPSGIAADANGKIAAQVNKLGADIGEACAGVAVPLALGECGGLTGDALRDCVDAQVECRACLAINAADNLGVDCAAFAGIACPPAAPACGDGVRQGAEACDQTDDANCPGQCDGTCQCPADPPVCGDGVAEGGEDCDGADATSCPGQCQPDCSCPTQQTCAPPKGLTAAGSQFLDQDTAGVEGVTEPGDQFGAHLAAGDFDADGFTDLVIDVPGEDVGVGTNVGAVAVLYGAASGLYGTSRDQLWTAQTLGYGASDSLGSLFTVGDFNGDAHDDLAVPVFTVYPEICSSTGCIPWLAVISGSPSGLSTHYDVGISQMSAATAGEFNGDGYDDLIAVVSFDASDMFPPGLPNYRRRLIPGSASGLDMSAASDHFSSSYNDVTVMVSGDFDANPLDDLVEGYVSSPDKSGSIRIVFNPFAPAEATESWTQDSPGIVGGSEDDDQFGASLAVGDFDGDGNNDLAVGVPGESSSATGQGAFQRIFGDGSGLTATNNQLFGAIIVQTNAHYASVLAAGNFDTADAADELAGGAPLHDTFTYSDAGILDVRFSSATTTVWHHGVAGITGTAEPDDKFGAALAVGDFNGDGADDLAVGVPEEDNGSETDTGAVNILYGTPCP